VVARSTTNSTRAEADTLASQPTHVQNVIPR